MTATQTFSYIGHTPNTWVVPSGVSSVFISCLGAIGGGYNGSAKGGSVSGTLAVTPGETLYIFVGSQGGSAIGATGGAGGYNGGGVGGNSSGAGSGGGGTGGGGAADVRQGGSALANRVCVAGGGSGRVTNVQGAHGGGNIGATGPGTYGGTGGTQSSGGVVASGAGGGAGAGSLGDGGGGGGNSGTANPHYGAGGGGGGYYGGAGGGLAPGTGTNSSAGGGGSNYIGGLSGTTTNVQGDAAATGDASVTLTWNPPPSAPTPIKPAASANLDSTIAQTFSWSFNSADPSATLVSSQLQYRATLNNAGYANIDSVNLCPNPNFETDTSGWSASGNPAPNLYRTTTRSHSGSACLEVSSRGADIFLPGVHFTLNGLTIGQTYTVSGYVYIPSGNPDMGVYVFGLNFGTSTNGLVDQWVRVSYTWTATNNSHDVGFWQSSSAAGQIANIDDVLVEVGSSINNYFDGSSSAQIYPVPVTYSWTGAVNNSISTRARTWNVLTVGSGATTKSIAALTFANSIEYEWEVNSTDNDALTGPYSTPRTFTASQPVINLASHAGMSLTPSLTVLTAQPMAATGQIVASGTGTIPSNSAISSSAALTVAGKEIMTSAAVLTSVAALSIGPSHTLPFVSAMSSLAALTIAGFDTVMPTLSLSANAVMNVQVTLGVAHISVAAVMAVTPQAISKLASQPMAATSQLTLTGFKSKNAVSPMVTTAVLSIAGQTLRFPALTMAVHGLLSQSGTVSRSQGLPLAARAVLASQGLVQLTKPQPLAVRAALSVVGARNAIVMSLPMASQAGLSLVTSPDQLFSVLAMVAIARLTGPSSANIISITNAMRAFAAIVFKDGQSVGHTYLVVPSVNGSILTFTASGYPAALNTPSAESVGSVTP